MDEKKSVLLNVYEIRDLLEAAQHKLGELQDEFVDSLCSGNYIQGRQDKMHNLMKAIDALRKAN